MSPSQALQRKDGFWEEKKKKNFNGPAHHSHCLSQAWKNKQRKLWAVLKQYSERPLGTENLGL